MPVLLHNKLILENVSYNISSALYFLKNIFPCSYYFLFQEQNDPISFQVTSVCVKKQFPLIKRNHRMLETNFLYGFSLQQKVYKLYLIISRIYTGRKKLTVIINYFCSGCVINLYVMYLMNLSKLFLIGKLNVQVEISQI